MNEIKLAAEKINEADALLIGASNGLSISEGLHIFADDGAFEKLFGDFRRKYGLRCILHGMAARWPSEEEKWAFWSRLIFHYCAGYRGSGVMSDLKAVVGDKDYFIITSNGECHFELCGFAPDKIYEPEGNWLTMQCVRACHTRLYPTLEAAKKMAQAERGGRIPTELVPRCPICGGPMAPHVETDGNFIPDAAGKERLETFISKYSGKKLTILELGIGCRNRLIKAPLMRLAAREPEAFYITVNLGEVYIDGSLKDKSAGIDGGLCEILAALRKECER